MSKNDTAFVTFIVGLVARSLFIGLILINEVKNIEQLDECAENFNTTSIALSHATTGDVVVTPGAVCVISADPTLDEAAFTGYLTSCRRGWDLRRSQLKESENDQH